MDMNLTLASSLMRSIHSKKNHWCCLRVFVSLVAGNSTKICFVFWWKWTRPYMKIMDMFQTNFWTFSFWVVQELEIIWIDEWLSHDPVFPQFYRTIINNQELIIHNSVTQLVQYSLYTLPTMSTIYDKPGAGWDWIDPDDYFTSYFKTNEMGDVVQQEKNLQHHNSWKRITLLWWQWGILKLFAQN